MPTSIEVTRHLLRAWPLPAAGDSKYDRGQVVVAGGALRSPGAAILAGTAVLRVGAGRLTLAVAASVAAHVGVAVPECGVVPLSETSDGHVSGDSILDTASDVAAADAILVGPGLDDPDETLTILRHLPDLVADDAVVVLDAFALGALARDARIAEAFAGRLVLTPNGREASLLLERDTHDDEEDARELAQRFCAAVSYSSIIAAPDGTTWMVDAGNPGLGTSGSGDVLAGAITGLCARGATIVQATVWATWAHSVAGERLASRVGPLGYLASEIAHELPHVLR